MFLLNIEIKSSKRHQEKQNGESPSVADLVDLDSVLVVGLDVLAVLLLTVGSVEFTVMPPL
jgi:hypothetical protein